LLQNIQLQKKQTLILFNYYKPHWQSV